ncbi:MAG: SH3 domain-containing protein [Anaerolineae bacterium]|nr:SH3 domain-containing protein [Anaerolineae bacterium]
MTPTAEPTPAGPCRASITADLNVRAGPGTTYQILGTLKRPATVEVLGRTLENGRGWWRIDYGGARGWIASWYTATQGPCYALPLEAP